MSTAAGPMPEIIETPHFRVLGSTVEPRFPAARVDNELADHIAAELAPLGLVPDGAAFERIFVDTVLATAPTAVMAWSAFYRNTLTRLRNPSPIADDGVSTFGRIYAQVPALIRGRSVLDVGCCFGFLPLLLAESQPQLQVVGCDVVPGTSMLAGNVARSLRSRARFVSGDARRLPFSSEALDTVLLVHVLEHLPATLTLDVLAELCRVAARRVVIAVPLEDAPDSTYGHVQAFDVPALAAIGGSTGWAWAVHEYEGGWLVLERP